MQNFSCLACLEVAEKFVVVVVVGWGGGGVGWWWWSRPVLGFSFSQAEQHVPKKIKLINYENDLIKTR